MKHRWFLERAPLRTDLSQQYHSRYDMSVWEWSAHGKRAEGSPSQHENESCQRSTLMLCSLRPNGEWGVEEKYAGRWKFTGLQAGIQDSPFIPTHARLWGAIISQKAWQSRVWNIPRSCCKKLIAMPDFFPFQCVRWTRYTIKLLISGCAGSPCLFWEGSCHTSQVPLVFWFITPCVALCFPAFLLNLTAFSANVALAQSGRCVVSLASVNLCWPT